MASNDWRRAAAVEDEDVDAAKRSRHILDQRIDLIDLAGIADEGQDVLADLVGGSLRTFHRAAGEGDACALLRQALSDPEAQPLARAENERALSF
jgi:hypothetical protein